LNRAASNRDRGHVRVAGEHRHCVAELLGRRRHPVPDEAREILEVGRDLGELIRRDAERRHRFLVVGGKRQRRRALDQRAQVGALREAARMCVRR
jgi:hypothetical protein